MKYKQNKSSNPDELDGRCWIDHPDAGNSSCSNPLSCISYNWKNRIGTGCCKVTQCFQLRNKTPERYM